MAERTDRKQASETTSQPTIIIQYKSRRWLILLLLIALGISVFMNFGFMNSYSDYMAKAQPPHERFHSGESTSSDKIARLAVDFTILPPFSNRLIEKIEHVRDDDSVKGVLFVIDSPGGLVTDSHQIYDKLRELREKKPVFVSMKGIAASGGYYIAMGGTTDAPIYAEPTTWTGSIGVIVPRYDVSELGKQFGVKSDSLVTGPLKDTLNPLKPMGERETEVWDAILDDAFVQFLTVIDEGRPNLNMEQIRTLATGQVYTAKQALANGLVDKIGYEEAALEELKTKLGLTSVRVVEYSYPQTFAEQLLLASAEKPAVASDPITTILEGNVPRAMYIFGWHPGLKTGSINDAQR